MASGNWFRARSKRASYRRKGFSLCEIVVIIALLSILTAILFPIFGRAREMALKDARRSICASNLRQIGRGWQQYARDYDGKAMRFSTSRPGKIIYWWGAYDGTTLRPDEGLLAPYLKSVRVQICPAFGNNLRPVIGATGYAYNQWYLSPISYGAAPDFAETDKVVALSQIKTPSETVVMADSARLNTNLGAPFLQGNTYLSPPRYAYPSLHARHDSLANVLWADGHVSAEKPVFRSGTFGTDGENPYRAEDFQAQQLGDLDRDGNLKTNELFDLE